MNKYRMLYYPHFQPQSRWLLSILLLTDEVQRIVPKDADPEDSDRTKELIQTIPGAFTSRSPEQFDIEFSDLTLHRLRRAFQHIRKHMTQDGKRHVTLRLSHGTLAIDGHVLLHHSKVAPRVKELLLDERMLLPSLEEMATGVGIEGLLPIPEQASNLILSCIADRIATREGLDSATDDEFAFAMTAMDSLGVSVGNPAGSIDGALLSAVATIVIPQKVDEMSISAYAELRESFRGIRESFKEYATQIAAINRLARVEDKHILAERISAAAETIKRECDQYAKLRYARKLRDWAPFAVCSMLSVGTVLADPAFRLIFAAGIVAVGFLKTVFVDGIRRPETVETCRLLADMRRNILNRSTIAALS